MPAADLSPAAIAERARETGWIGIDTEFMSERRYRALLCLVQVTVADRDTPADNQTVLLDPLEELDPGPIVAVLDDPGIEVVLHAGRQDVAILRRSWGATPTAIFDTQVAAGFAGYGAQTSYARLLQALLRIRVAKTASFTRWDRRPLTTEQLEYARDDVEHLLELAAALRGELAGIGRLEWAIEECRELEAATDIRDPGEVWRRLPRVNQLDPRSRAVARALAAWREETAEADDRPVQSILADAALVELAKRRPSNRKGLESIRGLSEAALHRRHREILAAVEAGSQDEPIEREDEVRVGHDAFDGPLVSIAEALVRQRALEADLAYELLVSRAEVERVVRHVREGLPEPGVRVLGGWRRELVGEELLELLDGRRSLHVDAARRRLDVRPDVPADQPLS